MTISQGEKPFLRISLRTGPRRLGLETPGSGRLRGFSRQIVGAWTWRGRRGAFGETWIGITEANRRRLRLGTECALDLGFLGHINLARFESPLAAHGAADRAIFHDGSRACASR